jgi:hypothetical protein
MRVSRLVLLLASGAALAACRARTSDNAGGGASAANKAEEGQVSINVSGVEMRISIPEGLRREMSVHDESGLIYPGSTMSGVDLEGGPRDETHGEVELRFASADTPETVARWYREPRPGRRFTVASASREGADYVFAGARGEEGGRFRIRLSARADGGTDGRVLLSDRG